MASKIENEKRRQGRGLYGLDRIDGEADGGLGERGGIDSSPKPSAPNPLESGTETGTPVTFLPF